MQHGTDVLTVQRAIFFLVLTNGTQHHRALRNASLRGTKFMHRQQADAMASPGRALHEAGIPTTTQCAAAASSRSDNRFHCVGSLSQIQHDIFKLSSKIFYDKIFFLF